MDTTTHETKEQQQKIRQALNSTTRKNAHSETQFNNSWRKKLERKINK